MNAILSRAEHQATTVGDQRTGALKMKIKRKPTTTTTTTKQPASSSPGIDGTADSVRDESNGSAAENESCSAENTPATDTLNGAPSPDDVEQSANNDDGGTRPSKSSTGKRSAAASRRRTAERPRSKTTPKTDSAASTKSTARRSSSAVHENGTTGTNSGDKLADDEILHGSQRKTDVENDIACGSDSFRLHGVRTAVCGDGELTTASAADADADAGDLQSLSAQQQLAADSDPYHFDAGPTDAPRCQHSDAPPVSCLRVFFITWRPLSVCPHKISKTTDQKLM